MVVPVNKKEKSKPHTQAFAMNVLKLYKNSGSGGVPTLHIPPPERRSKGSAPHPLLYFFLSC